MIIQSSIRVELLKLNSNCLELIYSKYILTNIFSGKNIIFLSYFDLSVHGDS